MSKKVFKYSAVIASLLMTAVFAGCGTSHKEGSATLGEVAKVGDTACIQCHSAVIEPLTGESIIAQYKLTSPHNSAELGCESCHGGGAQHNGVGPIPYPLPDASRCATCHNGVIAKETNATVFATSNHAEGTPSHTSGVCVRCHTHEGAVLSNKAGFTGDTTVISSGLPPAWTGGYTAFKCETCHEHGGGLRGVKATDVNGKVVAWNPSKNSNGVTNQFNLCTSCHTMYNYNGNTLLINGNTYNGVATGTVGFHSTSWYRTIATTHWDNYSTSTKVEGYNLRKSSANPCFDCHGHEAKTGTRYGNTTTPSIYTDWAQSSHAGKILLTKYMAAAANNNAVTAVASAGSTSAYGDAWIHYPWTQTLKADGTPDRGACQKCHTATGISNFLDNPTGYDNTGVNNDFSHLQGWKAASAGTATTPSKQVEVLYCWGCHSNAGKGTLRNTTKVILDFKYGGQPIEISNAGKSTACVACHGGRGNVESPRSTRFQGHHAPTAGVLYSSKSHIGYEYAGVSYANPTYFEHDKIGENADGPCASCHMGDASHSFEAVTETDGAITAIKNQALCNTCHTVGGPYEMTAAKLEEEKAGYAEASQILNNYVGNVAGYTNYLGLAIGSTNYSNTTSVPDNAYGAYQNAKLYGDEPCAYVHNRIYTKRLIFDSIDWMDNGALNGTITLTSATMTAFPEAAAWLSANATTGVAARP